MPNSRLCSSAALLSIASEAPCGMQAGYRMRRQHQLGLQLIQRIRLLNQRHPHVLEIVVSLCTGGYQCASAKLPHGKEAGLRGQGENILLHRERKGERLVSEDVDDIQGAERRRVRRGPGDESEIIAAHVGRVRELRGRTILNI